MCGVSATFPTVFPARTFCNSPDVHSRACSRSFIRARALPVPDADVARCEFAAAHRFEGLVRLYGPDRFAALAKAHVLIIGLGGVGSWAVEALARSGIGALTLADLDDVCVTNVNRQSAALTSTIGMSKAHVLAQRVRDINPACDVRVVEDFVQAWNVEGIVERGDGAKRPPTADDRGECKDWRRPDYVLDAVDKERDKAAIVAYCVRARVPVCVTGGAGGLDSLSDVRCDDLSATTFNRLASTTRKTLRKEYGFPKDNTGPTFPRAQGSSKKSSKSSMWGVKCVYAPENENIFQTAGTKGRGGIGCEGVGGSAVFVTGAIGFKAASEIALDLMQGKTSMDPATTGWRSRVWPARASVDGPSAGDSRSIPANVATSIAAVGIACDSRTTDGSAEAKELAPSKRDASQPTTANLDAAAKLDAKQIFDAHCHWHLEGDHRSVRELCARLAGACVTTTRPGDWEVAKAIRQGEDDFVVNVPIAFGVHPWWAHLEKDATAAWMVRLRETVLSSPLSVVGEIGLDRIAVPPDAEADYDNQIVCFKLQLALATELGKPVVVHCVRATGDMQTIFRESNDLPPRIFMHSFGGSSEFLRQLTTMKKYGDRFYFGFSSVVNLRSPKTQDVIRLVPDDRLLLESDLCDPASAEDELRIMLAFIADVKGWSVENAARITRDNAERFYGL